MKSVFQRMMKNLFQSNDDKLNIVKSLDRLPKNEFFKRRNHKFLSSLYPTEQNNKYAKIAHNALNKEANNEIKEDNQQNVEEYTFYAL